MNGALVSMGCREVTLLSLLALNSKANKNYRNLRYSFNFKIVFQRDAYNYEIVCDDECE